MEGSSDYSIATLPDEELLRLYAQGSSVSFAELFRRYRLLVYHVAYRLLNHEADALDAVQEGFVNVLKNAHNFRGQSSFRTWLLRIVANAAMDLGRQRRRHLNRISVSADPLEFPDQDYLETSALEHQELLNQVHQALQSLPEQQRETFVLHVDGGLSYREVSEALGISIGTVMSRLFYARQRLKEFLSDQVLT